jgi:origin recognition complex subunit 1
VGDDAYVITDTADFEASGGHREEEDEPCELCHSAEQTDASPLLECDRCLRAFHTHCLDPPLKAVPGVDVSAEPALPALRSMPVCRCAAVP